MLSFKNFTNYLSEATASEIHIQFYKDIPEDIYNKLYKIDPTSKENMLGSYSKWLINLYKKSNSTDQKKMLDTEGDIKELLSTVDKAKKIGKLPGFDINKFKTVAELQKEVEYKIGDVDLTSGKEKKNEIRQDAKKVYEDENWLIVVPKTVEASCFYGSGTKWCTAANKGINHFHEYNDEGPLYIIISKNKKDEEGRPIKYQFHYERKTLADVHDDPVVSPTNPDAIVKIGKWIEEHLGKSIYRFFDGLYSLNVDMGSAEHIIKKKYPKYKGYGDIDISAERGLTSLKGCPREVEGDFDCSLNDNLTSLEGCPIDISGRFICSETEIINLKGFPKKVGKFIDISTCLSLKTFEGMDASANSIIYEDFDCSYCAKLENFNGISKTINGSLICLNMNMLKSCSKVFNNTINAKNNTDIENFKNNYLANIFKGFPKIIKGDVDMTENDITDSKLISIMTDYINSICKVGKEIVFE